MPDLAQPTKNTNGFMLHLLSHCLAAGISIRDSGVSRFDVLGEQLNLRPRAARQDAVTRMSWDGVAERALALLTQSA